MRNTLILYAVVVMLINACKSDKVREFIPGIYVNHAEGEYSTASDTLIIEPSESNNYLIRRRTVFNRMKHGKTEKLEHETEEWNAIYNEGTKSLAESSKGKIITFFPKANKLMVGKREYNKIN